MSLTDLFIRDRVTGEIHRVGDNPHDMLTVDNEGTIHYHNLQNGDWCEGHKSVLCPVDMSGYEFVPNTDEYGYCYDPREVMTNEM